MCSSSRSQCAAVDIEHSSVFLRTFSALRMNEITGCPVAYYQRVTSSCPSEANVTTSIWLEHKHIIIPNILHQSMTYL